MHFSNQRATAANAGAGGLLACVCGSLLWSDPGWCTGPELAKRGFIVAAALAGLMLLLPGWRRLQVPAWALALLALDLLLHLVSALFALHPWAAWLGGPERGLGVIDAASLTVIVLFGAELASRDPGMFRTIAGKILRLVSVIALLALLQRYAPWPSLLPPVFGERPYVTLGNPNYLGGVLAISLPAVAGLRRRRWLAGAAAAILLAALLATEARGALIAAISGGACTLALLQRTRPGVRSLLLVGIGGILALALVFSQVARPESLSIRGALYRAAIDAQAHPVPLFAVDGRIDPAHGARRWIGYGPDNIEPVLTRNRDPALNALEAHGWDRLADRAHNRSLDRLLELGLPGVLTGLLLALLPLLRGGQLSLDDRSHDATRRSMLAIATGCWVAFGVDGLFGVPSAATDLLGALALGVLISLPADAQALVPQRSTRSFVTGFLLILPIALAIGVAHRQFLRDREPAIDIAGTSVRLERRAYSAHPAIAAIERLQQANADSGALDAATARTWLPLAEHAVRAGPSLPRAWQQLGWLRHSSGDPSGARAAYDRALLLLVPVHAALRARTDRAVADIRAADQVHASDPAAALKYLHIARQRLETIDATVRDNYWYRNYAYLRAREGDLAAAIQAYRAALDQDPLDHASRRNLEALERMASEH